jgi:hypothetical protein
MQLIDREFKGIQSVGVYLLVSFSNTTSQEPHGYFQNNFYTNHALLSFSNRISFSKYIKSEMWKLA